MAIVNVYLDYVGTSVLIDTESGKWTSGSTGFNQNDPDVTEFYDREGNSRETVGSRDISTVSYETRVQNSFDKWVLDDELTGMSQDLQIDE